MATLNLTKDEFSDIAMVWLFDQVMNQEQIDNKDFIDFIEKHSSKLKTPLIKYYLSLSSEPRRKYKMIKGVFDGSDNSIQQIRIGPNEKIEKIDKKKDGIVKKVIKKLLKKEELTIEEKELINELEDFYL